MYFGNGSGDYLCMKIYINDFLCCYGLKLKRYGLYIDFKNIFFINREEKKRLFI